MILVNLSMPNAPHTGHRQRPRDRFTAGKVEGHSDTDEALLELLLSYAIPRKDVQALARTLITHFGTLTGVLAADIHTLCTFDGIKTRTAVLLKLADKIRTH